MADQTLAALTAATPATGGLIYGTQDGADRKFTLSAAGAALCEAVDAAGQITALGFNPGVSAWLAAPSSANLATALTDKTGTGLSVFSTAAVFSDSENVFLSGVQTSSGYSMFKLNAKGDNGCLTLYHVGGYPLNIQCVWGDMQITGACTSVNIGLKKFAAYNSNAVYENFVLCADSESTIGTMQMGMDHPTTPTHQTIKAHDVTTGTGADLTLAGGHGSLGNGSVVLNGGNRAAYDAAPDSATIRDILISHGLMAAS